MDDASQRTAVESLLNSSALKSARVDGAELSSRAADMPASSENDTKLSSCNSTLVLSLLWNRTSFGGRGWIPAVDSRSSLEATTVVPKRSSLSSRDRGISIYTLSSDRYIVMSPFSEAVTALSLKTLYPVFSPAELRDSAQRRGAMIDRVFSISALQRFVEIVQKLCAVV